MIVEYDPLPEDETPAELPTPVVDPLQVWREYINTLEIRL